MSLKNSIKGRKKLGLFRRLFYSSVEKNYSFSIRMSTRIKRLSLLYCKEKSKYVEGENIEKEIITFTHNCYPMRERELGLGNRDKVLIEGILLRKKDDPEG